MALVGFYDASTFVEGDFTTYPQLPPGAVYYQPAMHWQVTVGGVVQGQQVAPDDLLFATLGSGRKYGDNDMGQQVYGTDTHGDWTVDQVFFLRWDASQPGPIRPPYPNAGCLFTRDDTPGGNWAPGWRIVIDAYFNQRLGSRVYGGGNYGDRVFGDEENSGVPEWVDMTTPAFRVTCGDGNRDGNQSVVVSETLIEIADETGRWLDFADPWAWYQPQPGTNVRVGLIDPQFRYHPVITGQIERIEDVHDGEHPRVVTMRAFGEIMDLVVDVVGWQRPAELASTRVRALIDRAGWRFGDGDIVFPPDVQLIGDRIARPIVVRDEIDRCVQSVGWFFDQDRFGGLRVRTWPHEPTGTPLLIVDCADGDDTALVSHSITYSNDQSQLLNYVIATNDDEPQIEVRGEEQASINRVGKRGRALGYPKNGLAFADIEHTRAWCLRVVNRFSALTRSVETCAADTLLDSGWLPVLADLDTGQAITVERRGISPAELHQLTFDAVVVGFDHVITPGRWQTTLQVSTTTPSF